MTSTSSCLEKLSLAYQELDSDLVESILQNSETLKVLHLYYCSGLSFKSIWIITSLDKLSELNLGQTKLCRESITYLCNNLTPNLEKICLDSVQVNDDDIQKLTKRCNKLIELDLSNCKEITNISVTRIIENLSNSLVKLSLPYQIDDFYTLIELKTMSKLKYVSLARFRMDSAKKDSLKRRLNNIEINKEGLQIAYPGEYFDTKCTLWEIYCDQTDIS